MNAIPRWLIAVFVAMMLVTLGTGAWFYHGQRQAARQDAGAGLASIARLKADQIVHWRENQLAEATELMASRFLIDGVMRWLANPRAEAAEEILCRFRSVQEHYRYTDVLLLDTGSRVRLSLSGRTESLPSQLSTAVAAALRERKPVLTDLHIGNDSVPCLEVIAPLFADNAPSSKPVGAIVLQNDARESLYPLILSWPLPSPSAESLLVRRDGNTVLFLNELRHRRDTAIKFRISLKETDVPAVKAVLGGEGVVEGTDYRGVSVLSVVKPVPNSPWFLVTKVDSAEVFAAWSFRSFLILALILGCVLAAAAGIGIVWQRNLKAHYRALFQTEANRREIEQLYRSLFENMLNGFAYCRMIYDEDDCPKDTIFLAVNNAFGALTGLKDVVGKKASEVVPAIWQKDPELLETYDRVARTGAPEKFEVEVKAIQMWLSISVYRPLAGHFVTVFDVISRRKQAEQALRESEERYRLLSDNAEDFVMLNDTHGNRLYVSPSFFRVTGWTPDEVHQSHWRTRLHPDDVALVEQTRQANLAGQITSIEHRFRCRDGSWIWVESRCKPIFGSDGKVEHMLVWSRDITARKRAELALRESETLVRSITDHSEDIIFVKDRDSRFLFMNPAGLKQNGFTLEQILGHSDMELNPNAAEAATSMATDLRVMSSRQTETTEEEVSLPSGGKRVLLTTKTTRLDPNGNVIGLVGISRDITDRKRAEEALRESEERFRSLYTSMTEVVALHEIVTDSKGQAVDYRILDINPSYTKVMGISRDRAVGALASQLYGVDKMPYLNIYDRVAATGEPASFEAFIPLLSKHFEISVFSPQRGHFAIVASDISDRKQAESRLAKQQALLEGMNRILREAIRCETETELADKCLTVAQELTGSQFGLIQELNATGNADCLAMTSPGGEVCKMPQSEAAVLLRDMPMRGLLANVIQKGVTLLANDPAAHPDWAGLPPGHPPLQRFLGVPLKVGDRSIGLIGLANKSSDYDSEDQEVAESVASSFVEALQRLRAKHHLRSLNTFLDQRVQERTTQLETANRELESFSYSVSHDLRAPLRAISGFAGILAEDYRQRLDDEGQRLLDTITREAKQMGQLIDDLLQFSRVGRKTMQAAEVDMRMLAQKAWLDCTAQSPGRNLQFNLRPLPVTRGDAAMLRQVWTNLISNAVKYTRPKEVAVIEISSRAGEGELVYCVKDNGVGFDPEYVGKLFNVFQRLHSESEFEGTGVGLALVQRIIRRHGGRVWAEGKPNEGATFYFTLPT